MLSWWLNNGGCLGINYTVVIFFFLSSVVSCPPKKNCLCEAIVAVCSDLQLSFHAGAVFAGPDRYLLSYSFENSTTKHQNTPLTHIKAVLFVWKKKMAFQMWRFKNKSIISALKNVPPTKKKPQNKPKLTASLMFTLFFFFSRLLCLIFPALGCLLWTSKKTEEYSGCTTVELISVLCFLLWSRSEAESLRSEADAREMSKLKRAWRNSLSVFKSGWVHCLSAGGCSRQCVFSFFLFFWGFREWVWT